MEEDGEIFEVDGDENQQSDFSMSSYDGDNGDSLHIKPPQAQLGAAGKEKRDKSNKRERHHRHKGDSTHRHKADRHRSRSDVRAGVAGERRSRDKRRHRDREGGERESSGRRHRERAHQGDAAKEYPGRSSSKQDKERSRSGKREPREHRRGRSGSSHQHQQQQHMDHDGMDEYYNLTNDDHHSSRLTNIPPLMQDQHHHHSQQYGSQHAGYQHRSRHQQDLSLLHLSPRQMAEREKRMERMMAAEKQRELSQRDVESRRQRKEDKRSDPSDYQQQQAVYHQRKTSSFSSLPSHPSTLIVQASPQHSPLSDSSHQHHRLHKKKKHKKEQPEATDVHVISENEEEANFRESEDTDAKKSADTEDTDIEEKEKEVVASDASESASSDSSSDSDSDSDSSESDADDEEKKSKEEEEEEAEVNGVETAKVDDKEPKSGVSTPDREGRFDDSPESGGLSDVSPASGEVVERSPTKSPVPLKEILPSYFPAIMGCRSVDEFECLNRIAEGTYGVVYRAREKCNNTIVALKRLKMEKEKEGFPITSLREINTLLKGQHCNIVTVREIVVGSNMDKIYIVMDYVEHDLKSLMETMNKKKQSFSLGEVKTLMLQLLRAVHHLHDNWILHRDLKTSNLLLSHTGILKVGDFGLAREYGSPLKQYTPIVVTLWYRAPELLLGTKTYSTAIDVWSVGCIYGELLSMEPMFPGKSEIDELNRIFKELGTPSDDIWPGYSQLPVVKRTQFTEFPYNHLQDRFKDRLSDKGFHLMNKFLTYDPVKRITCQEALGHDYFHTEPPSPVPPAMFPTWPAKSENPNGISAAAVEEANKPPKPPSGGKNFKDLGDDDGVAGFFLGGGLQAGPGFQLKF